MPAALMRHVVLAERLRCDRRDGCFALLLVRHRAPIGGRLRQAAARRRVERALVRAVRGGDVVGRHDRHTTAALLVDCDAAGALKLADRLGGGLLARRLRIETHVVAYGSGATPDGEAGVLLSRRTPRWKRAVDVAAAGSALVMFAPLIAVVAAGVKLTSRGPIFFAQPRAGLGGRPFRMFKFRTMVPDAEAKKAALRQYSEQDGPAFKLTHDPRITAFGRVLRKTSLDELPQLWNIVRGDMSLVGPRPLPLDEQAGCSRWQSARLDVAPGLTCYWQVEGRNVVSFEQWMRMDLRYMHTRGPARDAKLLLRTLPAVLGKRGGK